MSFSRRSPRCRIFSAAISSPWNSSVRRQSCAMVASTRNTGSLPMSPLPKSLSSPQIATMIWRAIDAAGADAGRDILLEGFLESAALAAVEGEHRGILRDAAERLVDGVL